MGRAIRNLIRYARLLAQAALLRGVEGHAIHICVTVDFDLDPAAPLEGHRILDGLLRRYGIAGKATYLINPQFDLGAGHAVYRELYEAGNEIGLHSHVEHLIAKGGEAELEAVLRKQKAQVEERFGEFAPGFRARSFRSGSRVFTPGLFRVLERIGIRYDSTMGHHRRVRSVYGVELVDGCEGERVYYLRPEACRAEAPEPTELVEIPVTSQVPEWRALTRALRPGEPLVIATFVHPYNFCPGGRRSWAFYWFYRLALAMLARVPGGRFSRLSDAGEAWEAWYRTRND